MKMGTRCLEWYCRFVPDKEPESGSKEKRRLERSWPENKLKCHTRINITLLIQRLMKYNKQIWQKLNNPEWSTSHDSCARAYKMWKMKPSNNIYSLLNITSCTHHEQTIRIHVGNLLPNCLFPYNVPICSASNHFCKKGSIKYKKQFGHFSFLSKEQLRKVQWLFLQSPRKSIRKLCQWTPLIYRSTERATKHMKLYVYPLTQSINFSTKQSKWVWFIDFVSLSKMIPSILSNVFYVDEAQ